MSEKLRLLELFGGIGACSKALDNLGIDYEIVDYVEVDKFAVRSFNTLHDTNFIPYDIRDWDKNVYVDLIMHGSPCQDFSLVGVQAGGDEGSGTRSSLMYETLRIVRKIHPRYVIWENVRNLMGKRHSHNFKAYLDFMEKLGYTNYYKVLDGEDFGVPQDRERVFTVSVRKDLDEEFEFPCGRKLELSLQDVLEEKVDDKYYLSDKMVKYIAKIGTENFRNNDCRINLRIARPLTTEQNKRAGTTNYICDELPLEYDLNGKNLEGLKIRRLSPRETWRLMGFSDSDFDKVKDVNSDTQLYKQAGNSIVVTVLEEILKNLLKVDENERLDRK